MATQIIQGSNALVVEADGTVTSKGAPLGGGSAHASTHTNGTDDLQSATAAQKGLATATQITKLDGIATGAQVNNISDANATDLTDGGATTLHSHAGSGPAFPIGSVFIAVVSTDPATLLGYGTWSAFAAGRVLVGLDSGDTNFDVVEETGGAKTVASSAQSFAGSALGTHFHGAGTYAADSATGASKRGTTADTLTQSHSHAISGSSEAKTAGTPSGTNTPGAATSVVQPYIVVYMWKRTA